MRMRRWMVAAIVIVACLGAQTAGVGAKHEPAAEPAPVASQDDVYKELDLFEQALAIVQSDYVEEPKPKPLIYGALKGMLATLDPYSQFMDPDSYNELKIDTGGEFGGLGIEITIKDDLLTIIAPIDDTPAFRAGLMSGDRIVKIDGELTRGITLLEAVKKLRGKPHTKVSLTVLREGESELKEVSLERDIIKIVSVREAVILEDRIGYIRLSDFRENTAKDLAQAIAKLKAESMDSVILDLRNNPGGLLDVSVSVAELFLPRQALIVSTKGRLRSQTMEFHAKENGSVNGLPLVVLINEGSASASEIVAGAIQDHHRGVVMGMKSHGKASVQTIFPLRDGSALRLTTSKYFTPSGRSIHGQGILPDVEVPLERKTGDASASKEDQAEELFDRLESESKPKKDPGAPQDPEAKPDDEEQARKRKDNQLARAVDLLKGIRVYQSKDKAIN